MSIAPTLGRTRTRDVAAECTAEEVANGEVSFAGGFAADDRKRSQGAVDRPAFEPLLASLRDIVALVVGLGGRELQNACPATSA